MDRPESTPEYWRMKAEQVRRLAACLQDSHARVHMLAAAESYDRLAVTAEKALLIPNKPTVANP